MPIRVLVVWEPILPTDWMPPSGMVQSRISDSRVIQFWDKGHLVAKDLGRQFAWQPSSYRPGGTLWDFAALYGDHTKWGQSPPVLTGGPVVYAASEIAGKLGAAARR